MAANANHNKAKIHPQEQGSTSSDIQLLDYTGDSPESTRYAPHPGDAPRNVNHNNNMRGPSTQGQNPNANPNPQRGGPSSRFPNEQARLEHERRVQQMMEQRRQEVEAREQELELKYGADQVLALILPVSLCMVVVITTIRSVSYYSSSDTRLAYAPYGESSGESSGSRFGKALVNVIIIVGIILAMTVLLVVLYLYRCYKVIYGWLVVSSLLLLFYFSFEYIVQVLEAYNKTIDYATLAIVTWNFGWVGMVAIFWKAPLFVQQVYLILVSALMALVLIKNLPAWTTWILLGAIATYDLFAVLCPRGPLRLLVETAQQRNEPLFPALIYSSTMMWTVGMADTDHASKKRTSYNLDDEMSTHSNSFRAGNVTQQPGPTTAENRRQLPRAPQNNNQNVAQRLQHEQMSPQQQQQMLQQQQRARQMQAQRQQAQQAQQPQQEEEEEDEEEHRGVKLGLGDFIFYSVLVGRAATSNDWITILACYVAILIGLACTLLLLSIYKKALPALPISIAFGLIFYFVTQLLIVPMLDRLSSNLVFI